MSQQSAITTASKLFPFTVWISAYPACAGFIVESQDGCYLAIVGQDGHGQMFDREVER